MTVEITGPKAYEYQYTVTLWMTLMFLKEEEEQVFVENEGFEDAFLTYFKENKYSVDIQVKERSTDITLEEFCGWLAHFKQRKTDTFLLNRLQQENHQVVFVTNNRCTDKVSLFLKEPMDRKKLRKEEIEEIRENVVDSLGGKKGIAVERCAVLKSFFESITEDEFRNILGNVKLIENQSSEIVEENIFKILKYSYYIPEVMCKDVLNQMLEVVRCGRDTGYDIVPDIKRIIATRSMKRILQEDTKYYVRESLEVLIRKLDEEHVLLLTGVPFSGKTYLAKAIAQKYLEQGYSVKRAERLVRDDEAYNFLWSKESDSRLLLLEDPFGHICVSEDSLQEWDRLNKVIDECISKNRKIIVTSRNDILLEVSRVSELERCNIQGHLWENVDINGIDEAKNVWEKYYGKSQDSQVVFDGLCRFFADENMKTFLEIGEIAHLNANIPDISELVEMEIKEIVECASVSAEEVCKKIEVYEDEYKKVFILLGGVCNTIKTISLQDFAYILHEENLKPAIRRSEQTPATVTIGGSDEDAQSFPTYIEQYTLDTKEKNILRVLCRKGYIYKDGVTNELSFRHPLYHYASSVLLKRELEEGWESEELTESLHKAVGSLARNAAICALDTLAKNFDLNEAVLECFFDGSNSIFPAVRDCAILFLDRHFDVLEEVRQHEFINNIGRNRITDKYLNWNGDECWYQLNSSYHHSYAMMWEFLNLDDKGLEAIEQKISNGEFVSKQEIYRILYSNYASNLPLEFLEYALLKEEAVIRSKAMYYIFSKYGADLIEVQEKYLNRFENYTIVYGILKGTINNWKSFTAENKRIIIDYVKIQLQRKSVAITLKDFMENFGDEHNYDLIHWDDFSSEERKEIWKVWAELFSQWLTCFPAKFISAHEPRMVYTAQKSLLYLKNENEVLMVAKAWLAWLKEYMRFHAADDYGMSVMEYLLLGTADTPLLRKGIIEQIIQEKDTNIITSHFSNIITNWGILCEDEKGTICDFLSKRERMDYKWIQAVCLVQKNVPDEVQVAICGKTFFEEEAAEILDILIQKEILEECLSIYCGFPQPLWWNGYHHKASYSKWDGIMAEVLKKKNFNQSYYIALREFVEALYTHEKCRFSNGQALYKQILHDKTVRKMVFERLAYSVNINEDCKEMWDDLLEASTEDEKVKYFSKIREFIELVEYKNMQYQGLLTEFNIKDIKKYILPKFPDDKFVINLCEYIIGLYESMCSVKQSNISYEHGNSIEEDMEKVAEVKQGFKEMIIKIYHEKKICLLFTGKIVNWTIKKLSIDFPEFQLILKQNKEEFWIKYENAKKKFDENCPLDINDSYLLKNWCHTRNMYTSEA